MKQTIRGMPVPNLEKLEQERSPRVMRAPEAPSTPKCAATAALEPNGGPAARQQTAPDQPVSGFQKGTIMLLAALTIPLALMVPLGGDRLERQRALPSSPVPPHLPRSPSIEPAPAGPSDALVASSARFRASPHPPGVVQQPSANQPPSSAPPLSAHVEFVTRTAPATELDGAAGIVGERSLASLAPHDVMTLQRELQRRGLYSGSIDGLIGPVTTEGLLEAERRRSGRELQAIRDGRIGSALWNELVGAGHRSY